MAARQIPPPYGIIHMSHSVSRKITNRRGQNVVALPYQTTRKGRAPYIKWPHRRIQFGDIMAYKQQRDAGRTHALDELAALNQEMGLYEN